MIKNNDIELTKSDNIELIASNQIKLKKKIRQNQYIVKI